MRGPGDDEIVALSVAPVIMAVVMESFPESRALANGIYMAMNFGVRAVVVLAVGAMADLLGLRAAFTISALLSLLSLPFLLWLPRARPGPA